MIGGAFTQVNGIARPYLARLNPDGLVDLDFDTGAGFNSPIFAILAQSDGKVVVGGSFTAFDGQSMNRLARLRGDGSWDASFDVGAGATDTINTLAAQADGKLLAGGNFARFNNLSRGYLARVLGANNAARGELAFGAGAYRVRENQPLATIEVRRTGSLAGTVTVAFATSNGTATAGYYTPQSGTLVFAPNETSKTFTVPVKNNNLVEDDKTVNLTLSNPSGGGVLGSQRTALLTIVNDDNNTAVGAIDASFQAGVNGYVGGVGVLPDGRVVDRGQFFDGGWGGTACAWRSSIPWAASMRVSTRGPGLTTKSMPWPSKTTGKIVDRGKIHPGRWLNPQPPGEIPARWDPGHEF